MPRRGIISLPAEDHWVRTARHFVAALLIHWGVAGEARDSALLIVSELAGNAALYGRADMTVSLTLEKQTMCIEVTDSGTQAAARPSRYSDPCDEHGRGLDIVGYLANWTETHDERDGRQVRAGLCIAPAGANGSRTTPNRTERRPDVTLSVPIPQSHTSTAA
ncbi:ATP-binding protein [Streptomyces goshikiensis]|uniref:ATP-binding protein n=1 Tax=Streptomyces goshikiensis TaxID=1942 RepID=UPI0033B37E6A